jgi:hypothetical protein
VEGIDGLAHGRGADSIGGSMTPSQLQADQNSVWRACVGSWTRETNNLIRLVG